MSDIAFICPIYDSRNHFDYGINLLKSKIENHVTSDLFFIFSSELQKVKFERMTIENCCNSIFKFLILPEEDTSYKSQVTVKKFYGLNCLKDKYKYIATIDSEVRFIKTVDFDSLFEEMWNNNDMLKANKSPNGFFIMRKCFKTLGLYNNKILKKETSNYLYNIWFNDIPIYKCEMLRDFFRWLSALNQSYKNEWMCFEYYIFMAFLIIEKGYHIRKFNIESLGGVMEYLYIFPKKKQQDIVRLLDTHWTSSEECIFEEASIRFHLDRDAEDKIYNSNSFFADIKKYRIYRYKQIIKDYIGRD